MTIKTKTLLIDLIDFTDNILLSPQDDEHYQESVSTKEYRIEPASLSHPNKWLIYKIATDFDQRVVKKRGDSGNWGGKKRGWRWYKRRALTYTYSILK